MKRLLKFVVVLGVLVSLASLARSAPAGTFLTGEFFTYQLTDLGSLGGADSRAIGLNDTGAVAGWAFTPEGDVRHAYSYVGGALRDLCPDDMGVSEAHSVNNHGTSAGWAFSNGNQHASVWDAAGCLIDLDPHGTRSSANAMNDAGHVTGDADFGFGTLHHAFRYDGALRDLGTLGGSTSCGTTINSAGNVAGWSLTADRSRRAFFCNASEMTMRELPVGGAQSQANGMNDWNEVIGWTMDATGHEHAFAYSPAGEAMTNLCTLGDVSSAANDISNNGDIVGWWSPDGASRRAFAVLENHMVDLNSLVDPACGWTFVEASAINESGQIVGYGIDPAGVDRGFLLTPTWLVPSPAAAMPFVFAATAATFRRRKNCQ